jgi:A/G-specific adenine glycosylase
MLQQTRVETVMGYYGPWLERFPDVETLARASLDDVLLQWQGLGYYRRARNLHRAAAVVRERHDGRLPVGYAALRALPGVGEYTAGAVASIVFGEAVPAVDGNVRRVLARLFDESEPSPGWLRAVASRLVDFGRPGDWNQALMDLGATTCTPRTPDCARCPVAEWCDARARGTQAGRPAPSAGRKVPTREMATAVVADRDGRVLVVRRPEDGLLGGMWSFPAAEFAEGDSLEDAARTAAREAGADVDGSAPRTLEPVRHRFTHLEATYRPVLLRGEGSSGDGRRWVSPDRAAGVALPVAQQKIARAAAAALSCSRSPDRPPG